jgi:hypothetical protein
MLRLLLFLLLALVSSRPVDAIENDKFGWTEYRNDRFGLAMRYPSAVFTAHRSSASGDGDLYETPDGKARLLVGALANSDHFTPRSYQTFIPAARAFAASPLILPWTDSAYLTGLVTRAGKPDAHPRRGVHAFGGRVMESIVR